MNLTEQWRKAIRNQMASQGINYSQLAKRLGKSKQQVHHLLTAPEGKPQLGTVVKYANALGCRVELKVEPTEH